MFDDRKQRKAPPPRMRSIYDAPPVPAADMAWEFTDYEDVPLERLRPYLDPKAVKAAIDAAVALGVREMSGVRIWRKRQEEPEEEVA